jgi:hypothetical protein
VVTPDGAEPDWLPVPGGQGEGGRRDRSGVADGHRRRRRSPGSSVAPPYLLIVVQVAALLVLASVLVQVALPDVSCMIRLPVDVVLTELVMLAREGRERAGQSQPEEQRAHQAGDQGSRGEPPPPRSRAVRCH